MKISVDVNVNVRMEDPQLKKLGEQIMAGLTDVQTATFRTGEAARKALAEARKDFQAIIDKLNGMIASDVELAELKAGLQAQVDALNETAGQLEAFDLDPLNPPPPPPVEPPA